MSSCWPGTARGYGIQARTVSPAGTASASTVSDLRHAHAARQHAAAVFGQRSTRRSRADGRSTTAIGPSVIGVCTARRATASGLRRNRLQGERLKYSVLPSMTWCSNRPGCVPLGELGVGEVGDLLAHARLDVVGAEGEVEQDAAHAFALERERVPRVGGQAGLRQGAGDRRVGGLEVAGVDLGDDGGSRRCRRRRRRRTASGAANSRASRDTTRRRPRA